MNFGLSADKLIVIAVIALMVVGPERLPKYAEGFARLVKRVGEYLRGAKDRVSSEMGPEFEDVDWRKLDPRQYDPRRIIREAILDEVVPSPGGGGAGAGAPIVGSIAALAPGGAMTPTRTVERLEAGELPPYDSEAT
ncbi:Sec-independent protein translocase TatB [Microbacterium sp. YY-03]|uniref:Sec-independent protein translocase TatB n=1 Tax=Microbacterium sp. YY-03 TaxID=3421636 RepID=UPI003D16A27C